MQSYKEKQRDKKAFLSDQCKEIEENNRMGKTRDLFKKIRDTKQGNISCSEKESEIAQSCSTLCNPMDYSLPGSSGHGIFQARVLEWVAISFSRGSSWPRDRTRVSFIAGRRFAIWATREAPKGIWKERPLAVPLLPQCCDSDSNQGCCGHNTEY